MDDSPSIVKTAGDDNQDQPRGSGVLESLPTIRRICDVTRQPQAPTLRIFTQLEDAAMICGTRTRSGLSLVLMAALFFFQHGATLLAQAEKFREDMQKGDSALNQRNFEAAVTAYKNAVKDARSFTGADLDAASAQANLGLSRAYLGLGAFKNALQSSEDALKHTGTSPVLESMV